MPVVLICPREGAYLFDTVMKDFTYRVRKFGFWLTKSTRVYDTEGNQRVANSWLLDHDKYCIFETGKHRILVCEDPFEMRG